MKSDDFSLNLLESSKKYLKGNIMKKLHISIIGLFAIALLACICISCVSAEDTAQDDGLNLQNNDHNVILTSGSEVLSADNETGKCQAKFSWRLNSNGQDMSNVKIGLFKIINRCGGADYVKLCVEPVDASQSTGSFVKEVDLHQGYILLAYYDDVDGIQWSTNWSGEMYID